MRRVVVTGLGAVTPIGNNVEEFWNGIKAGKCGIDKVTLFDATDFKTQIAGEVKNFEPTDFIEKKDARKMDRYTQLAMVAADEAVKDSGLNMEDEDPWKVGVITGSGIGGIHTLEEQHKSLLDRGPGRVSPFFIPMMIGNMGAAQIAIKYGARGVNENIVTACASGTNAIGDALRHIQHGANDVIIAGGAEAVVAPLTIAGFQNMKALSTNDDPKHASRPFDKNRDGFIMGEGAGMLVLEEYEHAVARGAKIYAELSGYGNTCDAHHVTAPDPNGAGLARAIKIAFEEANVADDAQLYINAHGTSTHLNDLTETMAIKTALGEKAYDANISSTKSMTGHLLGATGAIEAIASVMALNDGVIPPTINLDEPDEGLDLNYTPNKAVKRDVNVAASTNLGFGGHDACLVFKKY